MKNKPRKKLIAYGELYVILGNEITAEVPVINPNPKKLTVLDKTKFCDYKISTRIIINDVT